MSGAIWAAASGLGFGLFQAVNVRGLRELDDPYLSTLLQLISAAVVCVILCAVTGELAPAGRLTRWAVFSFVVAGLIHFFLGWTLLNASQHRIGAARTAPLLATVPLWGIAIAAVVYGELPPAGASIGIVVIMAGALAVSSPATMVAVRWQDSRFALATAFLWALSPIFTIEGLHDTDSPLLGVTIGLVTSALAYAVLLLRWPGRSSDTRRLPRAGFAPKMLAGTIIAFATWWRFEALDRSPVGVVLALSLLVVPAVLILTPIMAGGLAEAVTARVCCGAALVVLGSLLLIAVG